MLNANVMIQTSLTLTDSRSSGDLVQTARFTAETFCHLIVINLIILQLIRSHVSHQIQSLVRVATVLASASSRPTTAPSLTPDIK